MAKRAPFTIDPALYVGRNFSPLVDFAVTALHGGTINTSSNPLGPNGMACIQITVPDKVGTIVNVSSNIEPNDKWTPAHAAGVATIQSITKERGDLSHNATAGVGGGGTIQGTVGVTSTRPGAVLTLQPGPYWVNVAPRELNADYDLRISISIM